MRYLTAILPLLLLTACSPEPEPIPTGSRVILDAPLPPETDLEQANRTWDDDKDPLWVTNIDVMDSDREKYVEEMRSGRSAELAAIEKLTGVTVTFRRTPVLDDEGQPVLNADGDPTEEIEPVTEYWFDGFSEPLHEGDAVDGTGFVIPKDWVPTKVKRESGAYGPSSPYPPYYMPPYGR